MTIPIAPILGLAAGMAEPITAFASGASLESAGNIAIRAYTGYDIFSHDWGWQRMMNGVVPLAIGLMIHKFVGGRPLNANAALARAGVPYLRI